MAKSSISSTKSTVDCEEVMTLTISEESLCHIKAASVPIPVPVQSKANLEQQTSAPSYLNSLRENDAPPFKLQPRPIRPVLVYGSLVLEEDVVGMIAAQEEDEDNGFRKFVEKFLIQRELIPSYALREKKYLVSLIRTTVDYAAQRDFTAKKLAALITIYLCSHLFFKRYYWTTPEHLWEYFTDLMTRHTVTNSPDGEHIFESDESYDIVTHFHTIYMNNLPLIHMNVFGAYRLKMLWPFKKK